MCVCVFVCVSACKCVCVVSVCVSESIFKVNFLVYICSLVAVQKGRVCFAETDMRSFSTTGSIKIVTIASKR